MDPANLVRCGRCGIDDNKIQKTSGLISDGNNVSCLLLKTVWVRIAITTVARELLRRHYKN
jgi:hypothetical protein